MRGIDTSKFTRIAVPDAFGPAPDLRWIDIAALVVDPAYQREIGRHGEAHIRRIAEAFDWRQFSAVVVSPVPGGRYAIIDGQHRTTAAALVGLDSVPCQIIQADAREQARAFAGINGRKVAVTTDQRYRAALAAGVPDALRIKALTNAAGIELLTFNPSSASLKPGQTTAHGAIAAICRQDGGFPSPVLRALRLAAGETPGVLRNATVLGVMDACLDHLHWLDDTPRMLDAFAVLDLEELYAQAQVLKAARPGTVLRLLIAARVIELVKDQLARAA